MKLRSTLFIIAIQALFVAVAAAQNITTIIGGLGDGGAATSGKLYNPNGVAVDKWGNMYVADYGNALIRKIDTTGKITSYNNIGQIRGVAVDTFGNLYAADYNNRIVRKISLSGMISVYAGNGSYGWSGDGGPATSAHTAPYAVAVDRTGNLYIADYGNCVIRKVDTSGIITTIAGNGSPGSGGDGFPATTASLNYPTGICVDISGNVYIADNGNNKVRKVAPSGIISTFAGNGVIGYAGDGGPATDANFNKVYSVTVDGSGNVYIADNSNNEIRKVNTSGIVTRVGGAFISGGFSGDGGAATAAQLSNPTGIATDIAGNYYIADNNNHRIRKVNTSGTISTIAGCNFHTAQGFYGDGGPVVSALLNFPTGLAFDTSFNLYIADFQNYVVRKVNNAGIITSVAGNDSSGFSGDNGPAIHAKLRGASSVATDRKGNLYICDYFNNRIRKVNSGGVISTYAGNGSSGFSGDGHPADSAKLGSPLSIATDKMGNLYIADKDNNRIRKVDTNGIINTIAGNGASTYFGDSGPATSAQFSAYGLCLDIAGNIYIADASNNRIRKIDTNGIITTVAGGGTGGMGGLAIFAAIGAPQAVHVDKFGNIFISVGNKFYKVNTLGIISNFAGTGTSGFSGDDGPALLAKMSITSGNSVGMATNSSGDVLITDMGNCRIRKVYNATVQITTPNDTICTGLGATFTATVAVAPIYTPYYHWQKNDTNVGTNSPIYTTPTLANNDKIVCYITDGLTGPTLAISNQINIFVPSLGGPHLSINSSLGTSVCQGSLVTCSVSSVVNGGTSPIYDWYKNGVHVFTGSSYVFTPVNHDTIRCKLTSSISCILPDTAVSANLLFTTYVNIPSVSLTSNPGTSVCDGTSVTITTSPTYGGTSPVYRWYKNDTFVATGYHYIFTPVNGDMVYCKMTSNGSCLLYDTALGGPVFFTVNIPATPSVSISSNKGDTICSGTTITCAPTPVLGGTHPVYNWIRNDIFVLSGSTFSYAPANGDSVYCTMVSNATCLTNNTAFSNKIIFAYSTPLIPAIGISSVTPGDTICAGTGIIATTTDINGGTSPTYRWYVNGNARGIDNTYQFTPNDKDRLYCIMTSNACADPKTATSDTVQFSVKPTARPSVTFDVDPGTILCNDIPVMCTPTGTNPGSAPLYDWYRNGDYVATANQYSFTPEEGDQVYTRLRSNADCASPDFAISSKKTFHIDSMPTVTLNCSPGQVNFSGTLVTFSANVSASYGTYRYQWYKNGVAVPDDTTAIYASTTFSIWDSVKCVVTVTGACSGEITSNTLVANTYHSMTLYPDPNYGDFIINGNNHDADGNPVSIHIYNSIGKLVYEKEAAFDGITFYTQINLGHKLPPGVYLLRMNYSLDKNVFHFVIK